MRDLDHPQDSLGGEDVTAALGRLRVDLNRRSELLFSADTTHQDPTPMGYPKVLAVKPGFQVDNPADLHEVHTSVPAASQRVQNGGSMRFSAEIAPATTLTSLTAYRTLDYELLVDGDITELDLTVSNVHDIQRQWSEELTVAHQGRGSRGLAACSSSTKRTASRPGSGWVVSASPISSIPTSIRAPGRYSARPRST